MMNKYTVVVIGALTIGVLGLAGCDKKDSPIQTDESVLESNATDSKTENDLYIERLNEDIKVEDPDALLDEVNEDIAGQ